MCGICGTYPKEFCKAYRAVALGRMVVSFARLAAWR